MMRSTKFGWVEYGGENMRRRIRDSRGFTLIAALLLTLLLSALAVGLLYTVTNEQRMGGNDLEGNLAFYGAESGMENLTSQLSLLYQSSQTPTAAAITALASSTNWPTNVTGSNITNMGYTESITWPLSDANGNPKGTWDIVGSGSDQGMVASMIPFNLQVTATRNSSAGEATTNAALTATGASVNLTRTLEVALLPAFEFGVFCAYDCDYFAGPDFNFGGRVHTNQNLFLASGAKLTFTDKIAAVGQVILDQLENGHPTSSGYTGTVYVPNAAGGCPAAPGAGPAANCLSLTTGSWSGGFPPTGSANTSNWNPATSINQFNSFIINGATGATTLNLPFVQSSTVGAIDIIRRAQASDTTLLSNSRLVNKAEIRILLADDISQLHPERGAVALDANDVQLGAPGTGYFRLSGVPNSDYMYFAMGKNGPNNWTTPTPPQPGCLSTGWPLHGQVTMPTACTSVWLRVEYLNAAGTAWVGVTQEWLGYGFGRAYNQTPTVPYTSTGVAGANPVSPAILILQQLANSTLIPGVGVSEEADTSDTSNTAYNWLPINFYDAREGEPRDTRSSYTTNNCSPNGVMNAVELDAGNLWLWLQSKAGTPYSGGSGHLVNNTTQNGYILYFSDRRGMQPDLDPNRVGLFYNNFVGISGLEDVVNSSSAVGQPDGVMEPMSYYATASPTPYSPEDVDINGYLDKFGQKYLGAGFGLTGAPMSQPYYIPAVTTGVPCTTTAAANMVTGPRHVLRLVDGGMDAAGRSYLPQPISPATSGNGFTVASEEPVYIWGNYNSGPADPFFPSFGVNGTTPHSAAAIIADAVTLLSPSWSDANSFAYPAQMNNRVATDSYYRVAIAAGKSIPFPQPAWGGQDFGTDGGMHNFLRYLENRGGTNVYYAGSLISMYYSQYATGNFKCCNSVYSAPTRNYFFDTQFLNPANLPPGTPMFQDVVSLSYHQNFTAQ
jgi:Tfp pilus assembly protein PilX